MAVSDRIVVMNQGRIVQQGSAEDLYQRPASAFVAHFIGRINALDARVAALDAGGIELQVLGRTLRLPRPAVAPPPGAAVQLMVRPEAVRVAGGEAGAGWPATVTACTFLGEKVELHLDCGGREPLLAVRPGGADAALPEGRAVTLEVDPAAWLLLPKEAAT